MKISPATFRKPALYGLLAVALVGSTPFIGPSCTELEVRDVESGLMRPATIEEVTETFEQAADVAKLALTASGKPEWYPFADIAVRLAVLIYAIRFGRPIATQPQATPTQEV